MRKPRTIASLPAIMASTLFHRNFILLWQGHLVSALGTQLFNIALMYWLLETTNSATTMGLVLSASLLPVAVLSVFTGVLVDRLPHKTLIVGADLIRGLLCLGFVGVVVYGSSTDAVNTLFVYAIIAGIASALFGPALRATLPEIVGHENVLRANGWLQSASALAGTLGPVIGGFLYVFLGAPLLFFVNGVSFLLSALSELFVRFPARQRAAGSNVLADVREGLSYMIQHRGLRRILATVAVMNVTSAPLTITLPMLVRDHHASGPELLGILAASQSVGSLTAAALLGSRKLSPLSRQALSWSSLGVCAASLLAMIGFESRTAVTVAFCSYGAGIVLFNVPIQSAIQLQTPERLRGRVISASTTLVAGVIPIVAAVSGVLVDAIEKNVPLVWGGAAVVFIGCAISIATSQPARQYLSANQAV